MNSSLRKLLLMAGVAVLVTSCVDGAPTGVGGRAAAIDLPIQPALIPGPADGGAAPIDRIRARVTRISDGTVLGETAMTVDPTAAEWEILLTATLPSGGPVQARIFLELINAGGGVESVEFSGLLDPVTLQAGQLFEPSDVPILRGPVANFAVTGVSITAAPDSLAQGATGALRAETTSSSQAAPVVFWTALDSAVATVVDSAVTGAAPGIGRVVASSGRFADTMAVTILPPVGATGPDLLTAIAVDDPAPSEGDTVRVTVDITNLDLPSATAMTNVVVGHAGGFAFVAAAPTQGVFDSQTDRWTAGDLAVGETATLALDLEVPPGSAGQIFADSAWIVSVDESQTLLANDTASVLVSVTAAAVDVSVLKTVDIPQPLEGDSIVFRVSVVNGGQDAVTDVVVFDTLPSRAFTVPSHVVSTGMLDGDSVWTIPTLAAGDTAIWTTGVLVAPDVAGTSATNTAFLRSVTQPDSTTANDTASVSIDFPLSAIPVVQITGPPDGSVYDPGDLATFSATAVDVEDGDLTAAIQWASDLDGVLATGGSFETSGLTTGVHTISAAATDMDGGTGADTIRITVALITTPTTLNVPFAATASLPITLSAPAPAGGLTLAVVSANPAIAQPITSTVFIAGGSLAANATLSGVLPGTVDITVSHPQFGSAVTSASVTAELNVVQSTLVVPETFPQPIDIRLQSQGTPTAAPGGGLQVSLTSRAPACAAVPPSVTIGAGLTEASAMVSAGGTPDLPCTAWVLATAPSLVTDSVRVTVNPAPQITMSSYTVGSGLQYGTLSAGLGTGAHGGVTVRIESSDPTRALVSPDASTPGTPFIDIVVPNGQGIVYYHLQGLEGVTGTATFTASAPGFSDGVATMTVVQPAFDVLALISTPDALDGEDPFYFRTGVPNGQLTALSLSQAVRAGGDTLVVTATSSDVGVGELRTLADSGTSVEVRIAPGSQNSPTTVALGGIALFPESPGVTTVTGTIPGFATVTTSSVDVTVSTPGITTFARTVGAGLQVGAPYAVLGAAQHGGVTVRIASSDPSLFQVSPDASTPGEDFIDVVLPNGQVYAYFHVQGVEGQEGVASVQVSAPGFQTSSAQIDVVEAAYEIIGVQATTTSFSIDDAFYVRTGVPNGQLTGLADVQALRAGSSPRTVTVTSDAPGVADLVTLPDSASPVTVEIQPSASNSPTTVATGGVAVEPVGAGQATISARMVGLVATSGADQTVTVTAPGISMSDRTVGAGLQYGTLQAVLGATDHPGVTVRVESADPAVLLVSRDGATAGTPFIDVPVPTGQSIVNYFVHGVEGQSDSIPLRISAPGFVADSSIVAVVQPAYDIVGLGTSPTTFNADDPFQVRVGVPYPATPSLWIVQPVRAGAPALDVTVSSSNTGVGVLTTQSSPQAQSVALQIPAGSSATGASVAAGGVSFDPLGNGSTNVVSAITGYQATTAATQAVTVTAPAITLTDRTVGAGLQYGILSAVLGSGNHGGVTVTLTSSNPSVFLVSPNDSTPGTESIQVVVPDQQSLAQYYIQGVEGAEATATLTATASGFTNGVATVEVVQPALDITSLSSSYSVSAADDPFLVRVGVPYPNETSLWIVQAIRAGGTPMTATVTSSAAATAGLVTTAQTGPSVTVDIEPGLWTSASTVLLGGVALDPLAVGTTTISATIPGVTTLPTGTRAVTINP